MPISFGDEVRCKITGFQGIANSRNHSLHGEDQIGVQPPVTAADPTKIPEPMGIDESFLEVVTPGKVKIEPVNGVQTLAVGLGDRARDMATGFEGIVVGITWFANGCAQVSVRPLLDEKGELKDPQHFQGPRLIKVEAEVAPATPAAKRTGGPHVRAPRRVLG